MIRKIPDSKGSPPSAGEGPQGDEADEADEADELPHDPGRGSGAGSGRNPSPDASLELSLEAVLFASGQALSAIRLAGVLQRPLEEVKAALQRLMERWSDRETAMELVEIAGGFRFMTRPAFQGAQEGLARKSRTDRLSPPALETLAVVAYRQPIGRAEIEAVRGVAAGPLLRVLLDRDLIRIAGRSSDPGHPLLYGTTKRFLDHFGLKSLKSLPELQDLLDAT